MCPCCRRLVVAVASWAADLVAVTLSLDTAAVAARIKGWAGTALEVHAPSIALVQNATSTAAWDASSPSPPFELAARAGVLLVVEQAK